MLHRNSLKLCYLEIDTYRHYVVFTRNDCIPARGNVARDLYAADQLQDTVEHDSQHLC